jgi:hypothetical protein
MNQIIKELAIKSEIGCEHGSEIFPSSLEDTDISHNIEHFARLITAHLYDKLTETWEDQGFSLGTDFNKFITKLNELIDFNIDLKYPDETINPDDIDLDEILEGTELGRLLSNFDKLVGIKN